jgi:hypothetical protein
MYTQKTLDNIYSKLSVAKIYKIRACIKAGHTIADIVNTFKISQQYASVLFLEFTVTEKRHISVLGHKDESYYEGDPPTELPTYSTKDLEGQELLILKWFEDGTYEGPLHGDNGEIQP